jgi:hypothetical protein
VFQIFNKTIDFTYSKQIHLWNLAGMELQMSGCGRQVAAIPKCVCFLSGNCVSFIAVCFVVMVAVG